MPLSMHLSRLIIRSPSRRVVHFACVRYLSAGMDEQTIVQYILVRKDLKWPVGAVAAQCCHVSMAAIWANKEDLETLAYLGDVDNMHKIVCAALSDDDVKTTSDALTKAGIPHKLWVEQPEGIVTAVATKPGRRGELQPFFSNFKLYR